MNSELPIKLLKAPPDNRKKRVLINLPDWLWAEINHSAAAGRRTCTAEVQLRLESTFPKDAHGAILAHSPKPIK